jgi:hypothetical protein
MRGLWPRGAHQPVAGRNYEQEKRVRKGTFERVLMARRINTGRPVAETRFRVSREAVLNWSTALSPGCCLVGKTQRAPEL